MDVARRVIERGLAEIVERAPVVQAREHVGARKKLGALKNSKLVLCSVNGPLQQLLKITGLDKMLTVKPTQHEAMKVWD